MEITPRLTAARAGARMVPSTSMGTNKKDHLLGQLDLLALRILSSGQSLHGYAIAERIQQLSENALQVGEGSLYPALHRMDESGWIRSEWASSETTAARDITKSPPRDAVNWPRRKPSGCERRRPSRGS